MRYLNSKLALAISLIVLTGLTACNTADRGISQVRQEPGMAGAGVDEAAVGGADLNDLEAGQPISYYAAEFNRRGYEVVDISAFDNRHVYDLRRGNERYLVSLDMPENQTQVSDINVERYRAVQAAPATEAQPQAVAQPDVERAVVVMVAQIRQLEPGKMPHEYIPIINRYGRVIEYEMDQAEAEIEFQAQDGRFYEVQMAVDPQTQRVTAIDVDRDIWAAF